MKMMSCMVVVEGKSIDAFVFRTKSRTYQENSYFTNLPLNFITLGRIITQEIRDTAN